MKFTERKKKLDYLLEMIEKGQCISTKQIAEKFNCSNRTVERMIAELKEEGIPIQYCKGSNKYKINPVLNDLYFTKKENVF